VEENTLAGGFGSAVMEYYSNNGKFPDLKMIGIPDKFADQASRLKLISNYGLDAVSITETVRRVILV